MRALLTLLLKVHKVMFKKNIKLPCTYFLSVFYKQTTKIFILTH